ncbi:hypothetical protein CSB09_00330 [Candidatus Gracilibacteria bacterium]|nr:MAG: hypothetical protein CSB09_00330 [Candidatus Gracilibacteria bacterium]
MPYGNADRIEKDIDENNNESLERIMKKLQETKDTVYGVVSDYNIVRDYHASSGHKGFVRQKRGYPESTLYNDYYTYRSKEYFALATKVHKKLREITDFIHSDISLKNRLDKNTKRRFNKEGYGLDFGSMYNKLINLYYTYKPLFEDETLKSKVEEFYGLLQELKEKRDIYLKQIKEQKKGEQAQQTNDEDALLSEITEMLNGQTIFDDDVTDWKPIDSQAGKGLNYQF